MNKTFEVIRFEVMRSIKKPSFWAAAILIPVLFAFYIFIAAMSGYSAGEMLDSATDTSNMTLGLYDGAEYLKTTKIVNEDGNEQEFTLFDNEASGIAAVQNKEIDVFYVIPQNFSEKPTVNIYVKPEQAKLIDNYSLPIATILQAQAIQDVSPINYAIITNTIGYDTTTYDFKDNHKVEMSEITGKISGPIIGLILFYILIVVLGNRLVVAMTEEKENRISELMLTSINPRDLIVGKIVSLMIVGIIQLAVLVIPMLILYKVGLNYNAIPELITQSLNALSIAQYSLLLLASYFLFTASCVIIGTITPTAKDANSYSSVLIIMVVLPIFFLGSFSGTENQFMMYFLTYFPPSAPIAIMLRAIFGSLAAWEFWVGLADIVIVGALLTKLATHIFCKNAIEFTAKINFKKLLGSPRQSWKN
jgi:ABC-2 type transport system permease protein